MWRYLEQGPGYWLAQKQEPAWYFKAWGVLASLSIFTNTIYMYRKNNYKGKAGVIVTSLGCAAIFVTINVPSAGLDLVMTARCLSHWATALIFAFLGAAVFPKPGKPLRALRPAASHFSVAESGLCSL